MLKIKLKPKRRKQIKQGFSLIELVVVSIIAGILISVYINIAGKQIKEGDKYAVIRFMDKINSKVCPAYISSFVSNNNLTNDEDILKHDFNLDNLLNKYSIKIPKELKKYIKSYSLTYKNFNCKLNFTIKAKKLPLIKTVSSMNVKNNGNTFTITLFYPISSEILFRNLSIKNFYTGKTPPGTFADYWHDKTQLKTNIGTLIQYNNNNNFNRISSYNWNKHDYESLSYHGTHIPDGMSIIH